MNARESEFAVLVPCLNEEMTLGRALESLVDEYVRTAGEVIVVDGGSTDLTREKALKYAERGWPVSVIDNPGRLQSHGLNVGLGATTAPVIVRADAHSLYPKDFVRRCVALLRDKGADNAGGVMWPEGDTLFQKAVACAMRHPAGVGDARYHLGRYSGWNKEGAYLGAFRRDVFEKVGGWDPCAHPNEDAELVCRMNRAGLKTWLDGSLRVAYFPRATLTALARQYFNYGRGRRYTTKKHGRLSSWRQAAPLGLLIGLAGSLTAAPFFPAALAIPGVYLAGLTAAAFFIPCGTRETPGVRARLVPVFTTMHIAWAFGFLIGPKQNR